jgi:uncharacterized MnhB-related membrane protein
MIIELLLVLLALVCGWQAVRAKALLTAALWLAGVSALVALAMYAVGARETAVIELSVGAGLVTILFVFAITIAGDEAMAAPPVIPRLLSRVLLLAIMAALGWFLWPVAQSEIVVDEAPFTAVLWQERGLDVLVQVALVFAGVMGVLGLLSEERVAEPVTAPTEKPLSIPPLAPAPPLPRAPAQEKAI